MLGAAYDDRIIDLLALSPLSTTRLAKELGVDDGALTLRLFNVLVAEGRIEISGAAGSTPVWTLTASEREKRRARS